MRNLVVLSALFSLSGVIAHGGVSNYTVGETWYPGYSPYEPAAPQLSSRTLAQRAWTSNDPIFDPSLPSMACNTPGTSPLGSIKLLAGQNLTAIYYAWLHNIGPMTIYLSPCKTASNPSGSCRTLKTSAKDTKWFKIGEWGLMGEGGLAEGLWYQRDFQKWGYQEPSEWSVRIPETLRAGGYLVRHEIVALHSENKPQFYPECVHVDVERREGSGEGGLPEGMDWDERTGKGWWARIPGVYHMGQPEINIDVYTPKNRAATSYKIPGPPVWPPVSVEAARGRPFGWRG